MSENAPYYQTNFPPSEFTQRRAKVFEILEQQDAGDNASAVLQGAAATGSFDLFRQTNEFHYLCGVEVPHAYLRLDARSRKTTLYLPRRDPKHEHSEGAQLHSEDPQTVGRLTGIEDVRPPEALQADLQDAKTIYAARAPAEGRQMCRDVLTHAQRQKAADAWRAGPSPEEAFRERLKAVCPDAEFRDLTPILDRLRIVKSSLELDQMRLAGKLSAASVTDAMRSTKAGLMEYQLSAAAEYFVQANGAQGAGYRPIIACGENIWNAHYFRNNAPLRDGELVLMDYAPDCGNYTSDVGRMWPVSGTYSPTQRALYGFIVEYHKTLLRLIRPGPTAKQVMDEAAEVMRPVVEKTAWSKPWYVKAARETLKFQGHLSHGVGMAVHEAGDYRDQPLAPGVTFALDPQLWAPEEKIYVRVEDTVVVTEDGARVLTQDAPLELDDVERTMREPGMLESF
ncbi:MAG: Xaa-Pro peptidase family protein, partial [Planctomycetales bacterium]